MNKNEWKSVAGGPSPTWCKEVSTKWIFWTECIFWANKKSLSCSQMKTSYHHPYEINRAWRNANQIIDKKYENPSRAVLSFGSTMNWNGNGLIRIEYCPTERKKKTKQNICAFMKYAMWYVFVEKQILNENYWRHLHFEAIYGLFPVLHHILFLSQNISIFHNNFISNYWLQIENDALMHTIVCTNRWFIKITSKLLNFHDFSS